VLIMPDIHKGFDVYCDASRQGLGCVLMQEGKVVAYASRQLRKCNTLILLKFWLYKNLLATIYLLKEYKVVLFNFRHLKLF
jgi:hypothetical protein